MYELSRAGRELWGVLGAIQSWGIKWAELAPEHAHPGVVLWSWCTNYLRRDRLPEGRVLVRFEFPTLPANQRRRRGWLLVENGDAELCEKHPGFEEDLVVVVNDPLAFARWHLGEIEWGHALRAGAIAVHGQRDLARALPTWNRRAGPLRKRPRRNTGNGHGPVADISNPHVTGIIPGFAGRVLTPDDEGYDQARTVWNGAIDHHPAYIARCTNVADGVAALRFARERDLPLAVRGGGHSFAGHSVCDDGLVIDLSAMKGIQVDPAPRTARAQAGMV